MGTSAEAEIQHYRNFLNWLFATFEIEESVLRREMAAELRLVRGARVLVTGCGLGGDIPPMIEKSVYPECVDVSEAMLSGARERFPMITFKIANAEDLPYKDASFDAAFHFGAINTMDTALAIAEMSRVVRDGGRVVFGDEGVAPWLRNTDYGGMAIANNPLWASNIPLDLLPFSATDVTAKWILGNCFYLVSYTVQRSGPHINPDIKHAGRRGGSMRTRYYGQLEGVSDATKSEVIRAATEEGISVHDWLERALLRAL